MQNLNSSTTYEATARLIHFKLPLHSNAHAPKLAQNLDWTGFPPYIHPSIHPSMHACMHAYIHTSIHSSIHTSMHAYVLSHLPTHLAIPTDQLRCKVWYCRSSSETRTLVHLHLTLTHDSRNLAVPSSDWPGEAVATALLYREDQGT